MTLEGNKDFWRFFRFIEGEIRVIGYRVRNDAGRK